MIAVIGGTGRLGRLVTAHLVEAGEQVRVVARSAPATRVPGAHFVAADLRRPSTLAPALDGADVVVAAAHGMDLVAGESPGEVDRDGNIALIDAARVRGADVVLVSVIGAAAGHPIELHRMKWAAEEHLRASGVAWTIVRASAFAEMWVETLEQSAHDGKGPQVFGHGENPLNFVSVQDVAAAVARAATDRTLRGKVVEVGGDDLTFNELARLVCPGRAPATCRASPCGSWVRWPDRSVRRWPDWRGPAWAWTGPTCGSTRRPTTRHTRGCPGHRCARSRTVPRPEWGRVRQAA
ncbi:SDR family oxidoreductase [Terrabacter sp. C0L_2]|uniref:SDR family oxidoreductase n=1 Tax=Terrabacter sp. C0L_2 TaxID=3108389 RepID=UPI002ED2A43D|nr:NAD(P)H-binding protein [Terrabacter sp. C0L_2]